ncbi:AraC family transcriptional regulator [Flavipsychrobacter stenotrophus]|uniref:AraC family transcriptional regulator n=2 Tax=Flavipsychrobacter stenotrophus TaxID=2077091 RepID=A0A2S7SSW4_9BACT|nr:AraC family transcriptional regulator [Flavipsychrobacter stenotrophus]
MTLFIKNMVCNRCKTAVKNELDKLGLHAGNIALGEVELTEKELSPQMSILVAEALKANGFELIDDRKSRIIEKIKTVIVQLIHHTGEIAKQKMSDVISKELHYDYPYLSNLFSEIEGITIEQYVIQQKVERIKELIVYDELTLSAIADQMGYSSVAHLSAQFKKITGLPPSHFKNKGVNQRKGLDEVGR